MVERIKAIGRDPRLVARTLQAARKALMARKPALQKELRAIERQRRKHETERANLFDAIAKGGRNSPSVLQRVAAIDDGLVELSQREEKVRGELAAIRRDSINEADLRAALESFTPIWEQLFPRERARVLHLLVESVTFDSRDGSVEIAFRPGGVRAMAEDSKEATA